MNTKVLLTGLAFILLLIGGCSESTTATEGQDDLVGVSDGVNVPADTDLSEEEVADLRFMREEEKLAHDVYVTLYDKWNLTIHQNISRSELRHTNSVKTLLDRYGLEDPVGANAVGVFESEVLQNLYNDLVAQGEESLEASLRVGCAIEEIDILDLEEAIEATDHEDIVAVYENLLRGSGNHLRAFVGRLQATTGEVYEPQYLTSEAYASIIDESQQRGGNGRRGNGGGRGNGGRGARMGSGSW